jgi:hypothetical protein
VCVSVSGESNGLPQQGQTGPAIMSKSFQQAAQKWGMEEPPINA